MKTLLAFILVSSFSFLIAEKSIKRIKKSDASYTVSIQLKDVHKCSGALISEQHVLSAATCASFTYFLIFKEQPDKIRIGSASKSKGGDLFDVSKIHIHHYYTDSALSFNFAIFALKNAVRLVGVEPIFLPTSLYHYESQAFVSGFGEDFQESVIPGYLRGGLVNIIDDEECRDMYKEKTDSWTQQIICAGTDDIDVGPCRGEAGNPLRAPDPADHLLIGIAVYRSPGKDEKCMKNEFPTVFLQVWYVRDWIKDIVGI